MFGDVKELHVSVPDGVIPTASLFVFLYHIDGALTIEFSAVVQYESKASLIKAIKALDGARYVLQLKKSREFSKPVEFMLADEAYFQRKRQRANSGSR